MNLIKLDVTDNIIGKINKELKFELYYFDQKIGYFESQDKIRFICKDFSIKDGRLIKNIEQFEISQYAENCDLGWF